MKIKKLPPEVRSKLESGLVITDAVRCIIELVHNSLDADATIITVKLDLKKYLIQVIDNGKGIGKDDLKLVGERFMTSKYQPLGRSDTISTYGYKGQAISSLLDVCKSLTIETKSVSNGLLYIKVFKNDKLLPIIEKDSDKNGTGTTVTVEDFMCTMPVRRKRINEVFDMEEIKTQLQYLGIIHHNVSFTLHDENKDATLLQKKPTSSVLLSISNTFGHKITKSLKPVSYRDKKYKITGFVSSKPQTQHNIQLVYINKRIISKGVIHKFVNNMMKEYIGDQNHESSMEGGIILQKLKNPTHYVFILLIKCPNSVYEFFSNLKKSMVEFKNWKEVMKCIHRAIRKVFKNDENSFDSSSVTKRKEKKKGENLRKAKFGTSLLINAVRGIPVKRKGERDNKNQKKKKVDDSVISEVVVNEVTVESVLHTSNAENTWSDSESPIPKSQLQADSHHEGYFGSPNATSNEFYEWVKLKYKTDENAFKVYQDFLEYKRKRESIEKPDTGLQSPILGKSVRKGKSVGRLKKSQKSNKFLKISPVKNQKATKSKIRLDITPHNMVDKEKPMVLSEPVFSPILNSNPGATVFCDKSSPPSSEDMFINLLKLRNSSYNHSRKIKKVSSTITHSWVSHYNNQPRDLRPNNISFEKENYQPVQENNVESNFFNESNLRGCNRDESLGIAARSTNFFQDAGIQTSLVEKSPAQKISVLVQTANAEISLIPESQSFEKSFAKISQTSDCLNQDPQISKHLSQEVPNPDFWNVPTPEEIKKNSQSFFAFKPKSPPTEKCSSSSEFFCGQKTNSSKPISVQSKETQTLAALWADVEETGNPLHSLQNSSNIEVTQLPDTVPVEDIGSIPAPPEVGFCLTERHDFMPKGLSPKFASSEDLKISSLNAIEKSRIMLTIDNPESELLANVKWMNLSTGNLMKPTIPDGILDEMKDNVERNKIFYEHEILSASLSCCAIKVHNLLHSFTFTKEVLSSVEVLGQLDKKFIVAKMNVTVPKKMELISLFDQHAVDERIKLEELLQEFMTVDGQLISSNLKTPIECVLNESVVRVLSNSKARLIDFGLVIKIINEKTISVLDVPLFLLEKHMKDLKNKKSNYLSDLLPDLVTKVAEELTETRGAASKIPKIVHNAFCSEACHKAIKFNKALEIEDMVEIIKKLKNCKLPFQCAHGRPSVIPIIDLEDFRTVKSEDDVNLEKVKKFTFRKSSQDDIIESSEKVK